MKKYLIGLVLVCSAAFAQAEAPRLRLYANVGYGFGGDPLMEGIWVNSGGQQVGTWDVKAGAGSLLAFGGDIRLTDRFFIQASVGHQRESVDGIDNSFTFTRVPVELLGFYAVTEQTRLGLGVRKAQGAKIRGGGNSVGLLADYESSAGLVAEGQYFFTEPSKTERSPLFGVYLRFVKESFKAKDPAWDTEKRDGSHIGFGLMLYY
jgi:hypothetical protein